MFHLLKCNCLHAAEKAACAQPGIPFRRHSVATVLVCLMLLSACGSNIGDPAKRVEEPAKKTVYSCSDVGAEAIVEEELRQNRGQRSVNYSGQNLHPHLEKVATTIAVNNKDRSFSDHKCQIISENILHRRFYTELRKKTVHYIFDINMKNGYIDRICITRNEYSLDHVIEDHIEKIYQDIIRDAEGTNQEFFHPHRTKKCFKVDELL